jgi:hypothetical protein
LTAIKVKRIQRGVNVPSEESSCSKIICVWDGFLVKLLVMWVHERDILQPLILLIEPVPNDLNLWLVWNCLEIGVEHGALGVKRLAMTVAV